ncbi:MAG: Xaa-Pro peptidase family protein [Candidatus Omnitrophica bacterium]|nr:Xaa-Pro peptidase family protein [Candidatus Omnitrophota bacterium]
MKPLSNLHKTLKERKLDGLLISHQPNITYITGYSSRDSYLLITPKISYFITDFRYMEEAKAGLNKAFSIRQINGSVFGLIAQLVNKSGLRRLGFESRHMPYAEYARIKEELDYKTDFIPVPKLVEELRQVKTPQEIRKIKKAIKINIQAFNYAKNILKPGMKELEIAALLERFIASKEAKASFEIIVASGPNSAFPHHIPSGRKIRENEPVLIDMGVELESYKSDLTRTYFLGKITRLYRRGYDIIDMAQKCAIKKIKPGIAASLIDGAARQYLTRKGLGSFFGHSLGHGIGLEVHEEPTVSAKNNQKLLPGMVFTVEPAFYLPKKFGIRTEDMVLVTRKGVEILSYDLDKRI